MARVQASDETWAAFRAQLGVTPVSVALGRLVEREVGRPARSSASDAEGVRIALDDAREVAYTQREDTYALAHNPVTETDWVRRRLCLVGSNVLGV